MPNCSVANCGLKRSANRPNITLHRLPKSVNRKKRWLDIIGLENLNTLTKSIFICSLHFEESCFNRTLNITTLRDDAVPSRNLLPPQVRSNTCGILIQNNQNQASLSGLGCDNQDKAGVLASTCLNPFDLAPKTTTESVSGTSKTSADLSPSQVRSNTCCILIENKQTQASSSGLGCDTQDFAGVRSSSYLNTLDLTPKITAKPVSGTSKTSADLPVHAIKTIDKLKDKCEKQKKKIKVLNEKVRRLRKKIANFTNIIEDLKERNFVNKDSITVLEDCAGPKDFLKRQIAKSKGLPLERHYSEETRKFALTLHFFSPKAYDFVRRSYNTCLPHPRTLSKWYQHINAEPGFCEETFETLKAKAQSSDSPVMCALVFDEMAIRKSLCWDPQTKSYYGRVNIGNDCDSDSLEIASQCLVLLLTCVNGKWKLPVGYFFITSLSGEQKSILVKMCIHKSEKVGVKVVSVTCDGPATNFSMFASLGCDLYKNQDVTTFNCSESHLHAFIDPCHVIKLIRNAFGELKVFYDNYGRKIDFAYLECLLKLQDSEGLHMANKLTKAHLMFAKQKMKVRLATQLLSNSVADALDLCENVLKLKDFEGCAATINFIRLLNDVFDVLNSHSVRSPGWKKAICPDNIGLVEALFESVIGYIRNLKLPSGQLITESRRKTGFIGLIVDMKSAIELFRYLVQDTRILKYIPIYKISQDHLELFFSALRARGGFNNNPNAVQFKAAFKRLLIRAEIRDGGVGNCIPLEQLNILTCSSKVNPIKTINDLTDRKNFVEVPEDDSCLFEEYMDCLCSSLPNYSDSVVTYIAGFIARKLSRAIKCKICTSLLFGDPNEYMKSLISIKTFGGLSYPSKELEGILRKTEILLKTTFDTKRQPENYYLYIFKFFIDYFGESTNMFNSGDMEHDANHKYLLIKSVIQSYMNLRYKYFGKKLTETVSLRNYLNKIVLFRNE